MRIARPLTFLLESIAIGVGVLFLGGTALADSSPATSDSPAVTVTSTSNSTVIIDDQSTASATNGQSASDTATTSVVSESVVGPTNEVSPVAISTPSSETITSPAATAPVVVEATTVPEIPVVVSPAAATNNKPLAAPFSSSIAPISIRSDLASSKYSSYALPYSQSLTTQTDLTENPAPVTSKVPAKTPNSAPTPTEPFGMVSALLALFSEAVPGVFVHSFAVAAIGYTTLLIVLTMVALAVSMTARTTVVSYGSWLKQTGYTSVTNSGLPTPFSSFAIPSMMGYVSAPAPYA